jgi:hypothetical protein
MTTATLKSNTVSNTLADIAAAVEKIKNDGLQNFPEAASIGDAVRQGDVYIQLMDEADIEALKLFYKQVPAEELENHLQLAPGNTKGSRHILQSAAGLEMWLPVDSDEAILTAIYKSKGEKMPANSNRWSHPYRKESDALESALALAGPLFKCSTPNIVAHPEHGDWALPKGTYRVIFQRTVDESQRIRRVLD